MNQPNRGATIPQSNLSNAENVGEKFKPDLFDKCQAKAWELLFALAKKIKPGMSEADGHAAYKSLCQEFEVQKNWHPAKIRFGENSIKGFRDVSEPEVRLKENDIFFLDLGPVFFDHEGDVGKTFCFMDRHLWSAPVKAGSLGKGITSNSAAMSNQSTDELNQQCACEDSEKIWHEVADAWKRENWTGPTLYEFAKKQAEQRGWLLNLNGASGHRIGDFPHALFHKGSLKDFGQVVSANRWILEIQIRHPKQKFGAFYEDVLK